MTTSKPRHSKRPRQAYHHGDLSRSLLEAAIRAIDETGERLSLSSAARAAGVSVAAPYRHYENREALLAAVLAEGFRDLTRRTEEARLRHSADPREALIETGMAYVAFAVQRPHLYRLMFGPECNKAAYPELKQAGHESLAVLHSAVSDARERLGLSEADVPTYALAGWSITHGFASLHVDGMLAGQVPPEHLEPAARAVIVALVGEADGVPRRRVRGA
jgi:AcrR family transcriptional regulator